MRRTLTLAGSSFLLFLLWLPGLQYPIISDTAIYALLGESLWEHGRLELLNVPYAKHLPLHGFLSYPVITVFGFAGGMKIATLLAGVAVLVLTYFVLREAFSERVALIAVPLVAIHHGFVLMTMLGSADLLFTALFLAAVYALQRSEEDQRWYIMCGLAIGLASLTRYNGVPLLLLMAITVIAWRREDLRSPWFWSGLGLGGGLFGLWLLRNFRVFGNPFHTQYTGELQSEAPNLVVQFGSNVLYYLNPLHNILPILFLAALYGIVREWKKQQFLLLSMLFAWVLTAIWWVQAIRFAFPAYPILIGFAVIGLFHLLRKFRRWETPLTALLAAGILTSHFGALCIYGYGECNSFFDRTIGMLPKNMGLSSEGFHTWRVARDEFNVMAPENTIVAVGDAINARMQKTGVFRSDIRVIDEPSAECPYYRLTQTPRPGEEILYSTEDQPSTHIALHGCPESL